MSDERLKAVNSVQERCLTERAERPEPNEPEPNEPTYHTVEIKKVTNGWIVRVGCRVFVSTSWDDISSGLKEYYNDPQAAQKKYCEVKSC